MTDHDPPNDIAAEQALIGAILTDPTELAGLTIQPADFWRPNHETIWAAIQTLNGVPDYPLGLLDALTRTGDLQRVGGGVYLQECMASWGSGSPAWYAERITRLAVVRRTQQALQQAQQRIDALDEDSPWEALEGAQVSLEQAMRDMLNIGGGRPAHHTQAGRADLTWLLDGQPPHVDPPTYCIRSDGHALFYPARVNGVYGDPESGKTWLAQAGLLEALHNHQPCAIVDVDHNGQQLTAERLLLLGATPTQLADPDLFRYYEPDDAGELRAATAELVAWRVRYAVLDSIGELLPMLGVKSNDNDEITVALRSIASPMARGGACVVTIDHEPKAAESRGGGFAIGGMAKKRALDGTYLHAETLIPPAPGQVGKVMLRIEKDRPGRLRAVSTGKYAGTLILDSTQKGVTTARIDLELMPIGESGQRLPTVYMERVSVFLAQNPGASQTAIELGVKGKANYIRDAITALIAEGHVATEKKGQKTTHTNITPYVNEES